MHSPHLSGLCYGGSEIYSLSNQVLEPLLDGRNGTGYMELRHLRYFNVLAEELHFGNAAERLHVVPSALSKNIRQLEEDIGVSLFIRNHHNVVLTQAGKAFLLEAQRTLDRLQMARLAARQSSSAEGQLESLWFGFTPSSLSGEPLDVLTKFRSAHPAVHFYMQEGPTDQLLMDLRNEKLDIVCTEILNVDASFDSITVRNLPLFCALSERHPLARKRILHLKDLANEPFIIGRPETWASHYDIYVRICRSAGFELKVGHFVDTAWAAICLVRHNFGVLLSHLCTAVDGVVFRQVAGTRADTALKLSLLRRPGNVSPTVAFFWETIRRYIATRSPSQKALRK